MNKHVQVVGAVILRDGLVLCAQRGPGAQTGLWEFPGGKIEAGEAPADALVREIREELGCEIAVGDAVATTTHAYDTVTITLSTYFCELISGDPTPHEHANLEWRARQSLNELEWAPADIPAVAIIMDAGRLD